MNYQDVIARYCRAYRERDREGLQSILTPNFHFVSDVAEYDGIEVFAA